MPRRMIVVCVKDLLILHEIELSAGHGLSRRVPHISTCLTGSFLRISVALTTSRLAAAKIALFKGLTITNSDGIYKHP